MKTSTSRSGKIARLPKVIREEVNRRLADHESSTSLLKWLNALPEAQAMLAQEFGGREIDRHNLHEWRHGGHAEWRREQEARTELASLRQDGAAAEVTMDGLAAWVAARYLVAAKEVTKEAGNEAAWKRLRECCSDIGALQRTEHRARRLKFEREKFASIHAVGANHK